MKLTPQLTLNAVNISYSCSGVIVIETVEKLFFQITFPTSNFRDYQQQQVKISEGVIIWHDDDAGDDNIWLIYILTGGNVFCTY